MDGYNFTQRVRKILALASAAAERRGHVEITPAHIALGLLEEGGGVACAILNNNRISQDDLRTELESLLPAVAARHGSVTEISYTASAKRVLERSMAEARELKHSYVGTEHLLLALLHPAAEAASEPFSARGLTHEKAMTDTLLLLGPTPPPW